MMQKPSIDKLLEMKYKCKSQEKGASSLICFLNALGVISSGANMRIAHILSQEQMRKAMGRLMKELENSMYWPNTGDDDV